MPLAAALLALALNPSLRADATLTIDASHVTGQVSPTFYGLMTEEINHSYDGGLYAELIRNRTFQDDAKNPVDWSVAPSGSTASISLASDQPLNDVLKTSLRLDASSASAAKPAGIANDGYYGIPVHPDTTYRVSFYVKSDSASPGPLTIALQSNDGTQTFASAQVGGVTKDWKQLTATLKTASDAPTSAMNRFVITTETPGKYWFNLVSLFPPTFNDRPNGNRVDLMKAMIDLKPAFVRLPGGNYLEGNTVADRFPWKQTLGDLATRPGHNGCWGYRASDGFGLLEYLEWAEDMHAEPVLAVYAGYSLQGEHVKPGPNLEPYVQEALDEIEYVTGDTSTKWGAKRAKDGHPAPFPLHWVEIGNEDFFENAHTYDGRFTQIFDGIRAKYPDLKLISTVLPSDKNAVHSRTPDAIDQHDYRAAADFEKNASAVFDKWDRKGPKIFEGEWAAFEDRAPWEKSSPTPPTSEWKAALGDGAWLAAMERNADVVALQCYAPLFARVDAGNELQWRPDLIGYDGLHVYGSGSYYAFQMFSQHHGTSVLSATLANAPAGPVPPLHYSVTKDDAGKIYIKMVNVTDSPQAVKLALPGAGSVDSTGTVYTLASGKLNAVNSVANPTGLSPVQSQISNAGTNFSYTFPPLSITAMELKSK